MSNTTAIEHLKVAQESCLYLDKHSLLTQERKAADWIGKNIMLLASAQQLLEALKALVECAEVCEDWDLSSARKAINAAERADG